MVLFVLHQCKILVGFCRGKYQIYLVFTPAESDKYLALVQYEEDHSVWIAAGIGAAAVVLVGILLVAKRRAKNSSSVKKTETE